MGSISTEDFSAISCQKDGVVEAKRDGVVYDIAPIKVAGLRLDELCSTSDTKEKVILLSWLIVLLRSQEGDGVFFEWAYGSSADEDRTVERHHFAANEFVSDLEASTEQCSAAIAAYLGHLESQHTTSGALSSSLLLSTGSLQKRSDKIQEEVSEPFDNASLSSLQSRVPCTYRHRFRMVSSN
jgi:hypothetical protein